ncbi:MAG TPA: DUF3325 family protein, partial [Limnobacter sp.]|nr:DUF3325 family protein [Limnobacter sp.]
GSPTCQESSKIRGTMASVLIIVSFVLLAFGLLCVATTQVAHAKHPHWPKRMATIGLAQTRHRRCCGALALCASATLLAVAEGAEFGLVLWVMAAGLGSALLAWLLSPS